MDAAPDLLIRAGDTAILLLSAVVKNPCFRSFVPAAGVPAFSPGHRAVLSGSCRQDEQEHERRCSEYCFEIVHVASMAPASSWSGPCAIVPERHRIVDRRVRDPGLGSVLGRKNSGPEEELLLMNMYHLPVRRGQQDDRLLSGGLFALAKGRHGTGPAAHPAAEAFCIEPVVLQQERRNHASRIVGAVRYILF